MSPAQIAALILYVKAQLGVPYVWGGKGDLRWHHGQVQKVKSPVFDCSGLVTSAFLHVGHQDIRASHNAQKLFDTLPRLKSKTGTYLVFFGTGTKNITHVGIATEEGLLEAGMGHECLVYGKKSCVKLTEYKYMRRDIVGYRDFPNQ